MNSKTLKKNLLTWTVSNYILLVWKIIAGLITIRLLFLGLGDVGYGFWALLWSVFGYSLLLDFGFGTSVQKYSAELSAKEDYKLFNKQLSTIVGSYSVMAIVIIILSAIMAYFLPTIFTIESENIKYYQQVFFLFGFGSALLFPLGAFSEVLVGIGKIHIKNIIEFIYVTSNVLGIYYLMENNYSVLGLTIFVLGLNLFLNMLIVVITYYFLPKLNISIKNFEFSYIKEIISFSFFAYLIIFANMIIYKTDQILLGIMLGMAPVAIYQIGSRLPNLLDQFSNQFQKNLSPVAARLNHGGEQDRLGKIMFQSNRIVTLGATLMFCVLAILAEPILLIWLEVTNADVIFITYIMLFSVYIMIIFRSVNNPILLMGGKHKFLSKVAIVESLANIGLSIIFINLYGVIGVAIGTLVPNILLSLFVVFPAASKYASHTLWFYFQKILLPTTMIAIIPTLLLLLSRYSIENWTFLTLVLVSGSITFIYLVLSYIFYLNSDEKQKVQNLFQKIKAKVRK